MWRKFSCDSITLILHVWIFKLVESLVSLVKFSKIWLYGTVLCNTLFSSDDSYRFEFICRLHFLLMHKIKYKKQIIYTFRVQLPFPHKIPRSISLCTKYSNRREGYQEIIVSSKTVFTNLEISWKGKQRNITFYRQYSRQQYRPKHTQIYFHKA